MQFSNKILVIDDEIFNVDIIQEYLEEEGFSSVAAYNGREGIVQLLKNKDVEAIILDRMMPELDGITFVKEVKKDPILKEIPIIMQTAASMPAQVREGLEAGVYYYLAKPYNRNVLVTILHSAVRDYRAKITATNTAKNQESISEDINFKNFEFRTVEEARKLMPKIAAFFPNPEKVAYGLGELLINAVEHGNLGISYNEKKELIFNNKLTEEINKRMDLPENKEKFVTVTFERTPTESFVRIKDMGKGFDHQKYMQFSPDRALDPNGRGIASSKIMSFSDIEYIGCGNEVIARVYHKN